MSLMLSVADISKQGLSPREFWNKATSTFLTMAEEARQQRSLDAEPTTEEPSWFADIPTNQEINRLVAEARVSQSIKRLRDLGLNLPDKPQQNSPSKKPTE